MTRPSLTHSLSSPFRSTNVLPREGKRNATLGKKVGGHSKNESVKEFDPGAGGKKKKKATQILHIANIAAAAFLQRSQSIGPICI